MGGARARLFGGLQHRAAPSCTIPLGNVADNDKCWEVPGRESIRSGEHQAGRAPIALCAGRVQDRQPVDTWSTLVAAFGLGTEKAG